MASIDIFNGKAFVPDWVAKWWEFDQAVSNKILSLRFTDMNRNERLSAGLQLMIASGLVASCIALGRDQQAPPTIDQLYSPAGEVIPMNMFGQSEIFYSVQPEFIDLGLVAQQVQVIQLDNSNQYTAVQIMEVQDADGERFYNFMFQGKDSQVKQKWAVLVDNTLFELDLVTKDGKSEFVSNLTNSLGELTPTQLIIDTPEEDGEISIPGFDIVGFFSGVKPVLAADEATSTSIPTITPTETQKPTLIPTLLPSDTPFVVDISPTKIKVTVAPLAPATSTPEAPKSFITPNGHVLPSGSHLDEFGDGSRYVTLFLTYDPCPDVAKIDDSMLYDPRYEKGGVEFMCFWNDVFNGGAWVDGRRLIYPPKQP